MHENESFGQIFQMAMYILLLKYENSQVGWKETKIQKALARFQGFLPLSSP